MLIKPEVIPRIVSDFFIVPAHKTNQKNQIPVALANVIRAHNKDNSRIANNIVTDFNVSRRDLPSIGRLFFKPSFKGEVIKNADYLLVDDVLTHGTTLNCLKRYIEKNGGNVIDINVLAHPKFNSPKLSAQNKASFAITKALTAELCEKYGRGNLVKFLRKHHIAQTVEDLTFSEASYVKTFSSLQSFQNRINDFFSNSQIQEKYFNLFPDRKPGGDKSKGDDIQISLF